MLSFLGFKKKKFFFSFFFQKCYFKKPISVSALSTLPDPMSIHVCPVNWQILDQYENTQEIVNSVHVTRCKLI